MGYVLFWLEAAITSVLFVALFGAWIARRRHKGRRIVLWIVMPLLTLLFWGVAITGFSLVYAFGKLGLVQLWMSSVCFGLVILASVIIARRGRRKVPTAAEAPDGLPPHRTWRLSRLGMAFVAAFLVTAMTYWNLSLAVQQEMAAVRAEAAAELQSVWPAPVPASMNAEPFYRQAYEMLDAQDTVESKWSETAGLYNGNTTRPATQPSGPALAKFGPALTLLHQAAAMPEYNTNIEFRGITTLLPPMGKYRALCKLLLLDALQATHDGHADQAMDDLTSSFNMASHIAQSPFVIRNLVAASLDAITVEALQNVLAIAPPTAESLGHLHISASSAAYASFKSSMKLEYAGAIMALSSPKTLWQDLVQCHDNPPQLLHIASLYGPENPYYIFVLPEDVAAARQYFQPLISLSDLPFTEWQPKAESLDESLPKRPGLLCKLLIPGFLTRVRALAARSEAQHRLAYLAKAMWMYRLKNGNFPEKLEMLAPDFVPVVPKDPFTDKDMLIGRTPEGKAFLYSVGLDMKDDGGKELTKRAGPELGDIIFYLEGGRALPTTEPAAKPGGG